MNAVRLRRKLESETLHLPELKPLIGKTVVIREDNGAGAQDPGCFAEALPAKSVDAKTKKALRALLTHEQFEALMQVVDEGGPDVDAIRRLRAASMI